MERGDYSELILRKWSGQCIHTHQRIFRFQYALKNELSTFANTIHEFKDQLNAILQIIKFILYMFGICFAQIFAELIICILKIHRICWCSMRLLKKNLASLSSIFNHSHETLSINSHNLLKFIFKRKTEPQENRVYGFRKLEKKKFVQQHIICVYVGVSFSCHFKCSYFAKAYPHKYCILKINGQNETELET